ncbi:MAG: CvpA family protein [Treponema sp.]|nr:CvpA family protein [Treponema sp.]
MNFAVIDIVFAGIILLFVLRCMLRGFISEAMSLASAIFGLFLAMFFFRTVGAFIRDRFMPEVATIPEVLGFIAVFLAVFIVARFLESVLGEIFRGFNLRWLDGFLGALLGFAEGVVLIGVILVLIRIQPFFEPGLLLEQSVFAELLLPFIMGRSWELPGIIALSRGKGLV